MLESQQLYKFDVHSDTEHLTEVLQKLAGTNTLTATKDGKIKFSGRVEIELDFVKQTKTYSISDCKSL